MNDTRLADSLQAWDADKLAIIDPLEQTQRMRFCERRFRAFEAQVIHEHERAMPRER